ncbi:MAG: hypothetical protein H7831_11630 [Magnetococcus sp. WYHC-3]
MSLEVTVEKFRSSAHTVHQENSKSKEFGEAVKRMNELWLQMNEFQRTEAIKGYEWMWVPPTEDKL